MHMERHPEFFLPDELLVLIISYLGTEDVLRCRCVCRKWKEVTSTRYFSELQLPNASPVILADEFYNWRIELLLIKSWMKSGPTISISKVPTTSNTSTPFSIQCSGNGLVVMKSDVYHFSTSFIVFNPLNNRKVKIIYPESLFRRTEAFAIYFHPILKEYCILWAIYPPWYVNLSDSSKRIYSVEVESYELLILGSEPRWRQINSSFIPKGMCKDDHVVLIYNYIYWSVTLDNDIVEFDIISEQFRMWSCPPYCSNPFGSVPLHLQNVGGVLSVFSLRGTEEVLQLTLKDGVEPSWECKFYKIRDQNCPLGTPIRITAPVDEGLLVRSSNGVNAVLNLKLGTIGMVETNYRFKNCVPHVMSFSSLENCPRSIWKN